MVNDQAMTSTVRVTKALGDMQRLRILSLLEGGELCVCQLIEVLGLAPSTVSKHLSLLSVAGLLEMRKEGRWAYYRLASRDDLPYGDGVIDNGSLGHGGIAGIAGTAGDAEPVLQWLRAALEGSPTIERDRALLETVLALDLCDVARNQRYRCDAGEQPAEG